MRFAALLLTLLLSAPAWSVTFDFESVPGATPIAYEVGASVPQSARISSLALPGGGEIQFRTSGGKKYAALVTHAGQTSIVAVNKKGQISTRRFLEISVKNAPKGTSIASLLVINAGVRIDNGGTPTDPDDDVVLGYDLDGSGGFRLRLAGGKQIGTFAITRTRAESLILTGVSRDVLRVSIGGTLTIGDLVVSGPGQTLPLNVPEPAPLALLGAAAGALALRARARRSEKRAA